jgi:hypothetical protein
MHRLRVRARALIRWSGRISLHGLRLNTTGTDCVGNTTEGVWSTRDHRSRGSAATLSSAWAAVSADRAAYRGPIGSDGREGFGDVEEGGPPMARAVSGVAE